MTNDDILNLADEYLGYSDFGNFYGSEDELLEFVAALLEKHRGELCRLT
jgi:hypothetical protein